jgi:hypothetical protein
MEYSRTLFAVAIGLGGLSASSAPAQESDKSWAWCEAQALPGSNWVYSPPFPNTPANVEKVQKAVSAEIWRKLSISWDVANIWCRGSSKALLEEGISNAAVINRRNGSNVYEVPLPPL